jgi:hypothetical protein
VRSKRGRKPFALRRVRERPTLPTEVILEEATMGAQSLLNKLRGQGLRPCTRVLIARG